jgi:hypothetical protein
MSELERAAARVVAVAVIVIARNHRKNRLQMRIVAQRRFPLHDPEIRPAHHADLAVGPGLAGNPIDRFIAILAFVVQLFEVAFGFVTASHILHHHGVPVIDERLVVRNEVGPLAVRRPNQNGG